MPPRPPRPTAHQGDGRTTLAVPEQLHDTDGSDIDGSRSPSSKKQNGTQAEAPGPVLFHKVKNQRSILSLLVNNGKIFAGTQGGEILVQRPERLSGLTAVLISLLGLVAENVPAAGMHCCSSWSCAWPLLVRRRKAALFLCWRRHS